MKRLVLLLVFAAQPGFTATIQTEGDVRTECSGVPGGAGMLACVVAKAAASKRALDRAEVAARAALPKVDPWPRFVAEAQQHFAQSRRDFARYRAAQCAFNASLAGGAAGNSREIMRLACIAELNMLRAAHLRLLTASINPLGE